MSAYYYRRILSSVGGVAAAVTRAVTSSDVASHLEQAATFFTSFGYSARPLYLGAPPASPPPSPALQLVIPHPGPGLRGPLEAPQYAAGWLVELCGLERLDLNGRYAATMPRTADVPNGYVLVCLPRGDYDEHDAAFYVQLYVHTVNIVSPPISTTLSDWVTVSGVLRSLWYTIGGRGGHSFDDVEDWERHSICLLYTSPSPRDGLLSRMPSSA